MTDHLAARVRVHLEARPGATARTLVRLCNAEGAHTPLTKRDLNPMLYRSELFRSEGWTPPRWFLRTDTGRPAHSGEIASPMRPVPHPPRTLHKPKSVPPAPFRSPVLHPPPVFQKPKEIEHRLFEWQRRAHAAWEAIDGRGIVEAVTGSGKTMLALHAIGRTVAKGGRCLAIVPSVTLLEQWETAIEIELGLHDISLLGGGNGRNVDFEAPVTLGVLNTVSDIAPSLEGAFDLLVADEVHRFGSATGTEVLLESAPLRLGLTATLERSDDGVEDVLLPYFGASCYRYDYAQAKADSVIAEFDVAFVRTELSPDERAEYDELSEKISDLGRKLSHALGTRRSDPNFFAEVAKSAGRFDHVGGMAKAYIGTIGRRKALLCDSEAKLDTVRALPASIWTASKSLLFCSGIDTAEGVTEVLSDAGVEADTYHSKLSQRVRAEMLDDLQGGDIEAVVAVNALDEGVDVPDLDLGILVSGSARRRQMIQRMGRIVRRKDDGRGAVFVVLYAADTSEDPTANPNPEGYFRTLTENASRTAVFSVDGRLEGNLEAFVDRAINRPAGRQAGSR